MDLRSDNAAKPTKAMRQFMCRAPIGDEEFGEDPTVRKLEAMVAELLGKEEAVFMPSGTMCNITSYFVHCGAEDEILIHESSHPVYSEYAGPRVHGRARLDCLEGERGILEPESVRDAITRASAKGTRTRLLSLENTHNRSGGSVWALKEIQDVCRIAHENGLSTHLDGARLPNAVVATGISAAEYCAPFDSAWIDLSKGLGCPSGAVLAGDWQFIDEARKAKYLFGGVMHKAGIVAAAGVYALRHHFERIIEDHERAAELASGLAGIPRIRMMQDEVETNIIYFDVALTGLTARDFVTQLGGLGVRMKAVGENAVRAVTHLDVRPDHIAQAIEGVRGLARADGVGAV